MNEDINTISRYSTTYKNSNYFITLDETYLLFSSYIIYYCYLISFSLLFLSLLYLGTGICIPTIIFIGKTLIWKF